MTGRRLRFALFGTGNFGPELARYICEVADLVAVCDPHPQSRKNFIARTNLQVREFDDHQRLLDEEEIDAVAITSPNHTHKEIAVAAAGAGKHVFCEKPMATSVPDCWEMVRACEQTGVRLMVGHKRRLRPPWARMIELRERLGEVLAITSCAYYDARPYQHHGWWTKEELCGGTFALKGVHIIDWMRAMCGNVVSVAAPAGPQSDSRYDFPDTLHLAIRFHSGAVAALNVSLAFPLLRFRESGGPMVVCSNGGMRFVPHLTHLDLHWQHREDEKENMERFDDLGFTHAYRKELGDFVGWIIQGEEPCLTWQEGLRCVEIMEAARRSAKENGRVIELPLYPELEP